MNDSQWLQEQINQREIERYEQRRKRRPDMPFDIRMATGRNIDMGKQDYMPTPSTGLASESLADNIADEAARQGHFMARAYKSRTIITLKRLYRQGDDKFPTGQKHRAINRSH